MTRFELARDWAGAGRPDAQDGWQRHWRAQSNDSTLAPAIPGNRTSDLDLGGPMRSITRNMDALSGRWCLDGTCIPIAQIRADARKFSRQNLIKTYSSIVLVDDELDAIVAFEFPAVRDFGLNISYASFFLECVCGEDTPLLMKGSTAVIQCICNRKWEVVVGAELLEGSRQ